MASTTKRFPLRATGLILALAAAWPVFAQQVVGPVRVTIRDDQQTEAGKPRTGFMTIYVQDKIRITWVLEVVPAKPSAKPKPGTKRRLDTVLVRYTIENQDTRPREVGARVRIDTYNVDNDGCLFA